MGFANRYNTQEEIPEDVRGDFVEDTISETHKGTWVSKDVFALEKSLAAERREHKEAKASITSLTEKLNGLQGEIDKIHELGSLEELAELRKKAEEANPPKVEELQKALSEAKKKLLASENWRSQNEARLNELEAAHKQHEIEKDRAKAKETINAVVKSLNGVNSDALSENLFYQYLAGNLKRNDIGEIVTAADGADLQDFAAKYAKEHGLILQNTPGGAKPPAGGATSGGKAALMAQYEEAKKAKDTFKMLQIKTELEKLQQ